MRLTGLPDTALILKSRMAGARKTRSSKSFALATTTEEVTIIAIAQRQDDAQRHMQPSNSMLSIASNYEKRRRGDSRTFTDYEYALGTWLLYKP